MIFGGIFLYLFWIMKKMLDYIIGSARLNGISVEMGIFHSASDYRICIGGMMFSRKGSDVALLDYGSIDHHYVKGVREDFQHMCQNFQLL